MLNPPAPVIARVPLLKAMAPLATSAPVEKLPPFKVSVRKASMVVVAVVATARVPSSVRFAPSKPPVPMVSWSTMRSSPVLKFSTPPLRRSGPLRSSVPPSRWIVPVWFSAMLPVPEVKVPPLPMVRVAALVATAPRVRVDAPVCVMALPAPLTSSVPVLLATTVATARFPMLAVEPLCTDSEP